MFLNFAIVAATFPLAFAALYATIDPTKGTAADYFVAVAALVATAFVAWRVRPIPLPLVPVAIIVGGLVGYFIALLLYADTTAL